MYATGNIYVRRVGHYRVGVIPDGGRHLLVDFSLCRGRVIQHHLHCQVRQLALRKPVLNQPQQRRVAEISVELSNDRDRKAGANQ